MIMGTKMYGLVTFDWKGRNWKEGRWGQRLSTCCIHAALVFCESCRGGVAAEQLLSAATERSSCANSCLWAEPLRPRGPAWWHWVGHGRGAETRDILPQLQPEVFGFKKSGFRSRCSFVGEKWKGRIFCSYLHAYTLLLEVCVAPLALNEIFCQ